jgi:hypothetical protein
LLTKDCEGVVQFFFDEIIMPHGCAQEILTDKGKEFCNVLLNIITIQMAFKHVTTSPYHPQCNGLTERFNRTLCALLDKSGSYDGDWNTAQPGFLFAYLTSVHSSTGFTPFELIYARKARGAMYANPVAGPIMEPVSFERHTHAFI